MADQRQSLEYKKWAKEIKERDGKCKNCGATEKLHAHHIIPYRLNESLRLDLSNGVTICNSCHAKIEGFKKGHSHSKKTREKLSRSNKGKKPWITGKKHSEEALEKMREAKLGYKPWNIGKKSLPPENRICKFCNIKKEITEFTPSKRGYFCWKCKSCRNSQLTQKRGLKLT